MSAGEQLGKREDVSVRTVLAGRCPRSASPFAYLQRIAKGNRRIWKQGLVDRYRARLFRRPSLFHLQSHHRSGENFGRHGGSHARCRLPVFRGGGVYGGPCRLFEQSDFGCDDCHDLELGASAPGAPRRGQPNRTSLGDRDRCRCLLRGGDVGRQPLGPESRTPRGRNPLQAADCPGRWCCLGGRRHRATTENRAAQSEIVSICCKLRYFCLSSNA